jgi:hypothetical protein
MKKETLSEKRHSKELEKNLQGFTTSHDSSSFGYMSPYPAIESCRPSLAKPKPGSEKNNFSEFEPKSKITILKEDSSIKRQGSDISIAFSYHESKISNLSYFEGDKFSARKIVNLTSPSDIIVMSRSAAISGGLGKNPNDPAQYSDSKISSFGRISDTIRTQKYQNSIEKQRSSPWTPLSAYSSTLNPSFFTTNSDRSINTDKTSSHFQDIDLSFINRKFFYTIKNKLVPLKNQLHRSKRPASRAKPSNYGGGLARYSKKKLMTSHTWRT